MRIEHLEKLQAIENLRLRRQVREMAQVINALVDELKAKGRAKDVDRIEVAEDRIEPPWAGMTKREWMKKQKGK